MNRSVLIAAFSLVVAAAVGVGFLMMPPNTSEPKVKQLEADLAKARQEVGVLKAEREHLIEDAKKARVPVTTGLSAKGPATQPLPAASEALIKVIPDPITRETMRKQSEVQVNMSYGRLFQKLSLNDEEQANFKQLLADRITGQTAVKMKMMDPNITPAGRQAVSEQMATLKQKSDADIRKFLNNDEDYNTYQGWEDTQPEHMQLQLAGSAFEMAGAPLSEEQRDQLVGVMANVRKSPSPTPGVGDPRSMTPESLTADGIAKQLQVYDANDARVREEAAGFLTPPQVEALKKMQEQIRTLTEAGMKRTGEMYGIGKK